MKLMRVVLDSAPIWLGGVCRLGYDYPLPIVDHREAVQFARTRFTELRKCDDYWDASRGVLQRHGSRKGRREGRPKRLLKSQGVQAEFTFGGERDSWQHLRTDRIKEALPEQLPNSGSAETFAQHEGIYICGDHRNSASIESAAHFFGLTSGSYVF